MPAYSKQEPCFTAVYFLLPSHMPVTANVACSESYIYVCFDFETCEVAQTSLRQRRSLLSSRIVSPAGRPDCDPVMACSLFSQPTNHHSSSLLSSSSSSADGVAFFVGFFFFFLFLLFVPVLRARGLSRILSTSSSLILLSVTNFARSGFGAAVRTVRPFLVIARDLVSSNA